MTDLKPKYPVYIPSKGRSDYSYTAQIFLKDGVPFHIVVEPQEQEKYAAVFGSDLLLVLPENNQGLIFARNWIREHSQAAGYERHWQFDDNIRHIYRRFRGKRLRCNSNYDLAITEEFTDRYENIGISGLNYEMFVPDKSKVPSFHLNCRVYSATLFNNQVPYKWRLRYNDDTDICLQVLSGGWCTVLINAFLVKKVWTMSVPGGNTADLYQGDGRLKMAKSLERVWPGVVETKRRWQRPQHVVKNSWRLFDTPLKLKPGLQIPEGSNEFGMQLKEESPLKSESLRDLLKDKLVD